MARFYSKFEALLIRATHNAGYASVAFTPEGGGPFTRYDYIPATEALARYRALPLEAKLRANQLPAFSYKGFYEIPGTLEDKPGVVTIGVDF